MVSASSFLQIIGFVSASSIKKTPKDSPSISITWCSHVIFPEKSSSRNPVIFSGSVLSSRLLDFSERPISSRLGRSLTPNIRYPPLLLAKAAKSRKYSARPLRLYDSLNSRVWLSLYGRGFHPHESEVNPLWPQ